MPIASFETPVRSGRSRIRTPFSSRTRSKLALMASEKSDSLSNSMANASRARESSAGRARPEPAPSSRPADARRFRSGPLLNSPYPKIGRQSGSSASNWLISAHSDSRSWSALPFAEALLPTLSRWRRTIVFPPHLLSFPPFGRSADHPGGAGRLWPAVGRIRFDDDIPPPPHAVQIRLCAREVLKLSEAHSLLADELHAIRPHHQ